MTHIVGGNKKRGNMMEASKRKINEGLIMDEKFISFYPHIPVVHYL